MKFIGQYVIVRTRSAGVHHGILAECAGTAAVLTTARRLWRWRGANTLHEVSLHGIEPGSRNSEPVAQILLTEAIEVIPCTDEARKTLEVSVWSE